MQLAYKGEVNWHLNLYSSPLTWCYAGCFVPLTLGMYWSKANEVGAIVGMILGSVMRIVLYYVVPEEWARPRHPARPVFSLIMIPISLTGLRLPARPSTTSTKRCRTTRKCWLACANHSWFGLKNQGGRKIFRPPFLGKSELAKHKEKPRGHGLGPATGPRAF